LWNQIEIEGDDLTLQQFLEYFKKEYDLSLNMIAEDLVSIYSTYITTSKSKERMTMQLV
jgi:hypothetical protein